MEFGYGDTFRFVVNIVSKLSQCIPYFFWGNEIMNSGTAILGGDLYLIANLNYPTTSVYL